MSVLEQLHNSGEIIRYNCTEPADSATEISRVLICDVRLPGDQVLILNITISSRIYGWQIVSRLRTSSARVAYLWLDIHSPISKIERLFLQEIERRVIGKQREDYFLQVLQVFQERNSWLWSFEKTNDWVDKMGVDFNLYMNVYHSILKIPIQVKGSVAGILRHKKYHPKIPSLIINKEDSVRVICDKISKIIRAYVGKMVLHLTY